MKNNGGQYEDALRNAPKPLCKRDNKIPYIQLVNSLIMEYEEWYENEVLPLLRRPNPANGARKRKRIRDSLHSSSNGDVK